MKSMVISRHEIDDILKIIEANPKLVTSTKAHYKKVIANYLSAGGNLNDADQLAQFRPQSFELRRLPRLFKLNPQKAERLTPGSGKEKSNNSWILAIPLPCKDSATKLYWGYWLEPGSAGKNWRNSHLRRCYHNLWPIPIGWY